MSDEVPTADIEVTVTAQGPGLDSAGVSTPTLSQPTRLNLTDINRELIYGSGIAPLSQSTSSTLSPNSIATSFGVDLTQLPSQRVATAISTSSGTSSSLGAATSGSATDGYSNQSDAAGRRVRLRPKPGGMDLIYGPLNADSNSGLNLLEPLRTTNGLVFPYQPLVAYVQEVQYNVTELVHTNQDVQSYARTPSPKLTVDGDFTVQNQQEGQYAIACIHFLRTVSKMWFGGTESESIDRRGTPPPVLLFDGYGEFMFNALPVIVTQFGVSLPKDVDYVPVDCTANLTNSSTNAANLNAGISNILGSKLRVDGRGYAWLPSHFTITLQLSVQNTPKKLRSFDMTKFRTGELLRGGSWL